MLAAELDLPYACIPAGTRNHSPLTSGSTAMSSARWTPSSMELSGGSISPSSTDRVFVNTVSLGLYADAVQRPGHREAKLHTLLETVPEAMGPEAETPHLRWAGPAGPQSAVAILFPNNAYRLGRALGSGTRPRLPSGELGITVLVPIAARPDGSSGRSLAMQQWISQEFEIDSDVRVPAGIDGEATELDPPLQFRTRPRALRVRIAPDHPGASPSARSRRRRCRHSKRSSVSRPMAVLASLRKPDLRSHVRGSALPPSSARKISVAFTRRLTSWVSGRPSFENMELTCFSTARLVRNSDSAMAPLLFPDAI